LIKTFTKFCNELAFLHLAKNEMQEVRDYVHAILKHEWIIKDGQHGSPEVRALEILDRTGIKSEFNLTEDYTLQSGCSTDSFFAQAGP
jgi:hypothetical protein